MNKKKLLRRAISGSKNFRFGDMVTLVEAFGFQLVRVSGSHHVFAHGDVPEVLNFQSYRGKG